MCELSCNCKLILPGELGSAGMVGAGDRSMAESNDDHNLSAINYENGSPFSLKVKLAGIGKV